MRGEYTTTAGASASGLELPPRARRIPWCCDRFDCGTGTTSACAENTLTGDDHASEAWNYLRVRGEYQSSGHADRTRGELPPRARRIRNSLIAFMPSGGTTSACAENTWFVRYFCAACVNYLRVRGEYFLAHPPSRPGAELPPRARRIHHGSPRRYQSSGTTSACAENTGRSCNPDRCPRNYLRVRGEYFDQMFVGGFDLELPPRARRIPMPLG